MIANIWGKRVIWMGMFMLAVQSGYAQLDESLLTWTPDRGISFNGSIDYAETEIVDDFNVDQITVETWVKFRDNTGQQQLLGRGGAAEFFTLYANNGDFRFLVENAGTDYGFAEAAVPPANTWVHITGTYDEETIRLYYNGILMAETAYPGVTNFGDVSLFAGALIAGERHLNGLLENIRIWNRALSVEDIAGLLATNPEDEDIDAMKADGLISYWSSASMDENVISDQAGISDLERKQFTIDETNLTFKPEYGIAFDGKTTYIKVEDGTPFNLLAFTLECWVYFDKTYENQVFMNRGGAPSDFTFYLYDRVRFLVQDAAGYSHANAFVPPANTWAHILGTHDEEGNYKLYYNGVLVGENVTAPIQLDSANPLYIGALEPGSRHLDGQLENLRIWNRALGEDEILALLQTAPEDENIEDMKANGLIAYWAARSVQDDNTVVDLTGNGSDGEFHTFEISEELLTFKPEIGIVFDGETTFARVDTIESFQVDTITVEAWVNLDPIFIDRTLSSRGIVSWGGVSEAFSLYGTSQYGNRIHFQISEFGDSAAVMPTPETWIHICATYDENSIKLYYNGVLVDDVDAPGLIDWPGSPIYIGALSDTSGLFEGSMENIRIWNRVLSEEEIAALLATAPADEDIEEMKSNGLFAYYSTRGATETMLEDLTGNGNDAVFNGTVPVENWSLY